MIFSKEKNKMNIVLLNRWACQQVGGVENHLLQLSKLLHDAGHTVHLISQGDAYISRFKSKSNVHSSRMGTGIKFVRMAHFFFYALVKLRQIRPDFVITAFSFDSLIARVGVCFSPHLTANIAQENTIFEKIENDYVDLPIFTNPIIANLCEHEKGCYKEFIISGGKIEPWSDHLMSEPEIKILTVCRLDCRKNLDFIFEIARSLQKRGISFEWNVVGTGDELDHLIALKDKYKLTQNINFVGYVSFDALQNFYNISHIFCLPSFFEGFGLVFLEAFSYHIPVVAKDGGATRFVIGSCGIVLDSSDPDVFSEAIILCVQSQAYKNKELYLDNLSRFSVARQTQQLEEIVGALIDMRRELKRGSCYFMRIPISVVLHLTSYVDIIFRNMWARSPYEKLINGRFKRRFLIR